MPILEHPPASLEILKWRDHLHSKIDIRTLDPAQNITINIKEKRALFVAKKHL